MVSFYTPENLLFFDIFKKEKETIDMDWVKH